MSGVERMKARMGGNIRESMGAAQARPAGALPPGLEHRVPPATQGQYDGLSRSRDALILPLDRLAPDPNQPRKEFDPEALAQLAESLRARGQLQPIRIRWEPAGSRWLIVAGERRWQAAKMAGLPSLLCVEARGEASAEDLLEDQLVENCVREDLKPIDQARAFKILMASRGYSARALAERLSVSHMTVNRSLALLDLPEPVQARVESGDLAPSVAFELGKLGDPAAQADVAARAVYEGLSREAVVKAVRAAKPSPAKGRGGKAAPKKLPKDGFRRTPDGAKVTVEHRKGVDAAVMLAAGRAFVAILEAELEGRGGELAA